ncbi:MAG: type II toxin-antitoxin system VapC family toxin [Planctomycetes bacterium]|nr:type II toxin-antitoxin system VapC family toxin [Planctomycetota bacterium]
MGRQVAIDTNILIHEIKNIRDGKPTDVLSRHPVVIPVAVLGEFLCGFENEKAKPEDRELFENLLENELLSVAPFYTSKAEEWARIRTSYFPGTGRKKDSTDLFIAAHVIALEVPLISEDDEKEKIFRQLMIAGELEWYGLSDVIDGKIPEVHENEEPEDDE